MYYLKAYCAGIKVHEEGNIPESELTKTIEVLKMRLRQGDVPLKFAFESQVATEVCIDVYEESIGKYRADLSTALK